jgi:hypothetical protein
MKVEICVDNKKIAIGRVGPDGTICDVVPFEGRGIGYGRYVQIAVTDGAHIGASISVLVMGDEGGKVKLEHPWPFK